MTRCIPTINGIVERAGTDRNGIVFSREGDGRAIYFHDPTQAAEAAIAAQVGIASDPEGTGKLRVRIGLHSGTVFQLSDGDIGGTPLNYSGRLHSVAHGGQIIMSTKTRDMLGPGADRFFWRNLGSYALRDFAPQTLWQLDYHHELGDEAVVAGPVFPPLKTKRRFEAPAPGPSQLIGRFDELAVLEQFKPGQVITITGPGGIGKTCLAKAFIENHGHRFTDGVCFVDLVPVNQSVHVANAVASALGVDPKIASTCERSITEAMAGSDALIVLDNCEHVADGASSVAEAAVQAGGPTVISTSRLPLGVLGEVVFPLGPLGIGNNDETAEGDSERLFTATATIAHPGFDPAPARPVVTEICERLGGMPLAIELAATRMSVLKPGDLLDLLEDDLSVLEGESPTIQNALRWSIDSLDDESQRIGALVADAQPDVALAELARVAQQPRSQLLGSLENLVTNGLVQLSGNVGASRYRMLQPLRLPISELLDRQQKDDLRKRQAKTYAELALDLGPRVQSSDEMAAVDQLGSEVGNIRAAVLYDIQQGNYNRAASVVSSMHMFGFLRMNYEVYSWVQTLLEQSQSLTSDDLSCENQSELSGMAAFRSFNQGDVATAMQLAVEADEVAIGTGPIASRVVLMAGHGMAGDYERANSELNRGLKWCDEHDQPFYRTNLHVIASMGLTTQGFYDEAAGLARHGLQLAERVANPSAVAWSLTALADARRLASPAEASALLVSALEIARSVSNQWVTGQALLNLSRSYRSAGELRRSAQTCADALGHCQQQANRIQSRQGVREAFLVLYELGEYEHARRVMVPLQKPNETLPPSPDQQQAVDVAIADLAASASPDTVTVESALGSLGHRSSTAEREALAYARSTLGSLLPDLDQVDPSPGLG